ncbi:hypothetical protein ACWEOW_19015 [Monashia sp. NPDC004114]
MSLDTFEQSLLTELRQHVSVHARTASAASRRRRHRSIGFAAGLAGTAAVLAVTVGIGLTGPSGAYAVEAGAHGSLIVTIYDLSDVTGLEHALAAKGVNAKVSYVAGFSQVDGESPTTSHPVDPTICRIQLAKVDGGLRFTLGQAQIAAGAELDIITSGSSPADASSPVAVMWSGGAC